MREIYVKDKGILVERLERLVAIPITRTIL